MKSLVIAAAAALSLAACSQPVAPATAAQNVALVAASLQGAFANLPASVVVPASVTSAVADVQVAAKAFAAADSSNTQVSAVLRIEGDLNAVVASIGSIPNLPKNVQDAVTAADVLLPVIEAALNMTVAPAAAK
jgi:hypothetical protein